MRKKINQTGNPPPELLEIIKAVNLIPFGVELKIRKFGHLNLDENPQKFIEKLLDEMSEFPLLIDYLKAKIDKTFEDFTGTEKEKLYAEYFLDYLEEFIKNRAFLKSLVGIAEQYNKHLKEVEKKHQKYNPHIKSLINLAHQAFPPKELEPIISMFSVLYPRFKITSKNGGLKWYEELLEPGKKGLGRIFFESAIKYMELTTDEEHQIQIKLFGLLQLIQGCDLRRFKQCATCQKIIWANRLDRKFCSRKCSNLGWQKIYQSDEKKRREYNSRRQKTYNSKKEQRQAKIKANKEKK